MDNNVTYRQLDNQQKSKGCPIGSKFGRLTTIGLPYRDNSKTKIDCNCSCGNSVSVRLDSLKAGNTKSCGCFQKELTASRKYAKTHGLSKDAHSGKPCVFYSTVKSAYSRCYNEKYSCYHRYGGRGITVEFKDEVEFINFIKNELPGWSPEMSLDRINNNLNYSKTNLRWATNQEQSLNRGLNSNNKSGVKFLSRHGALDAWQVRIKQRDINISKLFTDNKFGSKELAKQSAIQFIAEMVVEYDIPTY
jgi:hypothetical protein